MTTASLPLRARALRSVFRGLPIPGRYLAMALRKSAIDLDHLPTPIICRDRWDRFSVEINNPADIIERHILFQGYFEYRESLFMRRLLKPGNVFVDVGANIGWHSLLAADLVGQSGQVLAFEPTSITYDRLQKNIDLNAFTQVRTFHCGLSNREAVFSIFPCEDENSGANSLYGAEHQTPIERVTVRPGDQVLRDLGINDIDLCKIDVEGAELDVLEGLSDTFAAQKIRAILIEVNPISLTRAGRTPEELVSWLRRHQFALHDARTGRPIESISSLNASLNVVGTLES